MMPRKLREGLTHCKPREVRFALWVYDNELRKFSLKGGETVSGYLSETTSDEELMGLWARYQIERGD